MNDLSLTILPETPDDAVAIERLHERTFGPGRYAAPPIGSARACRHRLDLSFTARIGTLLVGSVRLTPVRIGETPALLLGPLTIEPPFRERGIGQALIERALADAKAGGAPAGRAGRRRAILRQAGFKRIPKGRVRCRARSIRRGCWSPSSPRAPSRACPGRSGRTGPRHERRDHAGLSY